MAKLLGKKKAETPETSGTPSAAEAPAPAKKGAFGLSRGGSKTSGTLIADVLPSVNLISPTVLEGYHQQALIKKFALGAVGVVAVVGLFWGYQMTAINSAQSDLDAAMAETTTLNAQVQTLSPVKNLTTETQRQTEMSTVLDSREVKVDEVFTALNDATPAGVKLASGALQIVDFSTNPAVASAGAAISPCGQTPNPFSAPLLVGCLRYDGEAPNRDAVGVLLTDLTKYLGFYGPYVGATTSDDAGTVTFTGSVALTSNVYKNPAVVEEALKAAAAAAAKPTTPAPETTDPTAP